MKLFKNILIIVAIVGLAATAGQDLIINTARLDGFIYGSKSGGIDTLIVPDTDSLGQYQFKNVRDPQDLYDAVNYKTLLAGGGAGLDSIPFNINTGDLNAYFGGVNFYSTNLDDRYLKYSDSTLYVTISALNDSLTTLQSQINNMTYVYTFILPVAGTLAQSVALVSDLPDGWTLTASGTNLLIEHNLNRSLANVGVKYNQSGTTFRSLVPYQTAFNTFQDDNLNNAQIISISNYFTQYALKVHLTFD